MPLLGARHDNLQVAGTFEVPKSIKTGVSANAPQNNTAIPMAILFC